MRTRIITILGMLVLLAATALSVQNGEARFQQGVAMEDSGDIEGAIQIYEGIARDFADNGLLTAKANLQLGICYEKLGQARARGYYEKAIKSNQTEIAAEAKRLLALLPVAAAKDRIEVATPYTEDPFGFALSPDGRSLVYQATVDGKAQLWLRQLDTGKEAPLRGTENARWRSFPFWSPDGKSIGFFAEQKLKRVDISGGVARVLADAPVAWGGTWSSTGVIVFAPAYGPLHRVSATGEEHAEIPKGAEPCACYPKFLSDGRHFLYYQVNGGAAAAAIGSLDPQERIRSFPGGGQAAAFAPPDQLLVVTGGRLSAQRLDGQSLQLYGESSRIAEVVGTNGSYPGLAAVSASAVGAVAYRTDVMTERQFLWWDRTGHQTGRLGLPDKSSPCCSRTSPNGRTVLYYRETGGPGSLWKIDTLTGMASSLFPGANTAAWSPDGERLAIAVANGNGSNMWDQPLSVLDGARTMIRRNPGGEYPSDWSQTGFLLFRRRLPGRSFDLLAYPPSRGEPIVVADTMAAEQNGRFSPNSHWIAYQSDEIGGRDEVFLQPFPGSTDARRQVSTGGGSLPQWGRDGRELYFMSTDFHLMKVDVTYSDDGRGIELGTPVPLFANPLPPGAEFEAMPDGERFLVNAPTGPPAPIIVLSNWAVAKKPPAK